jgi:signal transduction histidine kinase/phage shock protein PspC (stress-responsive transcriptional regulator)
MYAAPVRVTMLAEVIEISIPALPARRLHRADHAVVAGVAAGLAEHLHVDVRLVRGAFVALTPVGGFGALVYLAFWAVVPQVSGGSAPVEPGRRPQQALAGNRLLPFAALLVGGLLLANLFGLSIGGAALWPLVLGGIGVALVWREADDAQRSRLASLSSRTAEFATVREPFGLVRVAGGVLLLLAGFAAFVGQEADWIAVWNGVRAAAIVLAGVLLIFGPWWWRLVHELTDERRERIRSQERVEVATHVHDSVLHTLALIQRSAGDAREVTRLARGQERELRRWLYRPEDAGDAGNLRAALEVIAAEVEDGRGVTVEIIVVGDCRIDEPLGALVAATREALVNAAKHAQVAQISLYAEVEDHDVSVFVRDRGRGFDPGAVGTDRYGLAESVLGRMRRAGGTAAVRSSPGGGTEVQLHLARPST